MTIRRFPGVGNQAARRGIFVGTRGSKLAMVQATSCVEALLARHPALAVDLRVIETTGDQLLDGPLYEVGGKGLFIKELDVALAQNQIQLAVHSMKDLPGEVAPGLVLAAITERADPRDALVSREGQTLAELPPGAKVGTSSLRRRAQLLRQRADLEIVVVRGNIETRLRKLDEGQVDALLLACAGLDRLKLGYRITERLDTARFLPSPGQGALGVVVRDKDLGTKSLAMGLTHVPSAMAVDSERALLKAIGGDCRVPIGAFATLDGGALHLEAEVLTPDGKQALRMAKDGFGSMADRVGEDLAQELLEAGAYDLLRETRALLGTSDESPAGE